MSSQPKERPGCRSAYDMATTRNIDEIQRKYRSPGNFADQISFRGEPVVKRE
jgi:hypothetical protein